MDRKIVTVVLCLIVVASFAWARTTVVVVGYGSAVAKVTRSANFNSAENPLATNWSTNVSQTNMIAVSDVATGDDDSGSYAAYWDADEFTGNQFSQAYIWGSNIGVTVKVSDDSDSFYLWKRTTGTTYELWKVSSSSWSRLGDAYTVANGDSNGELIKLEINGTTLTPYVDGVAQATRTDSALSGTRVGILTESNISTGCFLDDWSGGDL